MTYKPTNSFNPKNTPQSEPIPGRTDMVENSAGGYTFGVDDWGRLDRFLILGAEGGTYYASERKLTREGADVVLRCAAADGPRTLNRIREISVSGRAPKNEPALFAVALLMTIPENEVLRSAAGRLVPAVARTGTHLLHLAQMVNDLGSWGTAKRRAFGSWFNSQTSDQLGYQAIKYAQRDGWSLRDVLRLTHPVGASEAHNAVFHYITKGEIQHALPPIVIAAHSAKKARTPEAVVALINDFGLPREAIPTELLRSPLVWDTLLHAGKTGMPLGALLRNLATMTRIGLLAPGSDATNTVLERLGDTEGLLRARVHPVSILSALLTYRLGHGVRGGSTWVPVPRVVDALDAAFYASFPAAEVTGGRVLLCLDVSGSMGAGEIAGVPGLTPRFGTAALALITAARERDWAVVGFSHQLIPLDITPRRRLDDVERYLTGIPFGRTDCALPMTFAQRTGTKVDTFVIYTDNETWAGNPHPTQALRSYRQASGIDARLVVCGMTSTGFTIADPKDPGQLDVVGFDTATPNLIANFGKRD